MYCFLQWINFEIDILQKVVVLYSMVIVMDVYLRKLSYWFQLASNDIYARASNTFKQ